MAPLEGIRIGVFVTKESANSNDHSTDQSAKNGFIDRNAHRTFVENVFSTSPYHPQVVSRNEK